MSMYKISSSNELQDAGHHSHFNNINFQQIHSRNFGTSVRIPDRYNFGTRCRSNCDMVTPNIATQAAPDSSCRDFCNANWQMYNNIKCFQFSNLKLVIFEGNSSFETLCSNDSLSENQQVVSVVLLLGSTTHFWLLRCASSASTGLISINPNHLNTSAMPF